MATRKKRHPLLSRASAYWRLASKAEQAGDHAGAKHYRAVADLAWNRYDAQRTEKEAKAAGAAAWAARTESGKA